MDYLRYSAEDFAMDERFRNWVRQPNPDSEQFWRNWLVQHPDKTEILQEARQLVFLLDRWEDIPTDEEYAAVWAKINETRSETRLETRLETRSGSRRVRPLWRQWRSWAAVVTGMALLSGGYYFFKLSDRHHYQTAYGQTQRIVLPDGSEVTLNAHSSLRLSPDWEEGHVREVWLKGEAFFEVVKKQGKAPARARPDARPADHRFIVHTEDLDVEVLGTQFNVLSRRGNTQVVLKTGKVKLDLKKDYRNTSIAMEPGELVEVKPEQKVPSIRKVKPALYSAWTRQQWILENTPLREVTDRLEETFGLEIVYEDETIAGERMSGVVSTENLDDLLDALSTINGLQMKKEGNRLEIKR